VRLFWNPQGLFASLNTYFPHFSDDFAIPSSQPDQTNSKDENTEYVSQVHPGD
jgi:hypothetical protein